MDTKTSGLGQTLLIVEDDVLPAISLRDELEDAGYHVLDLTGRRQEALQAAKDHRPDLALVNIELEGRDDGIALARDLKGLGVPSLFISGQTGRARSARTDAIGSLPKPYTPADVAKAVAYLLGRMTGDETLPCPPGLEVFGAAPDEAVSEPA
ncbi:MAG: response regulator [Phenylobacterium sp.]|nr:MAG: response regulator [Phenylobacterium sp.]